MEATEPIVTAPLRRPVLNDRIPLNLASQDGRVFHLFPYLPCEIRLDIWRCALRRRRFVRLYSSWGRFESPNPVPGSRYNENAYTTQNELGNLVSGQLYATSAGPRDGWESRRFPSALMAVSHEARAMALEFYYLRLPASAPQRFMRDGRPPWIYLNPDWDYVRLAPTMALDLMDFLWDCRQYDPKGEGIKHWVLTPLDLRALIRTNSTYPMGGMFSRTLPRDSFLYLMLTMSQIGGARCEEVSALSYPRSRPSYSPTAIPTTSFFVRVASSAPPHAEREIESGPSLLAPPSSLCWTTTLERPPKSPWIPSG